MGSYTCLCNIISVNNKRNEYEENEVDCTIKLPAKLSTTVKRVKSLSNLENAGLIFKFYEFVKYNGVSERHQNNNLKAIVSYSTFLGNKSLKNISEKDDICSFFRPKSNPKKGSRTKMDYNLQRLSSQNNAFF